MVAQVKARRIACFLGAAVVTAFGLLSAPIDIPYASADPCPDVEVVFARGKTEAPGVGGIGQPFVEALRSQLAGRSVGVYAVNYPATDFPTTAQGMKDASSHLEYMATNCPNTRMVLGGYSLGAAVIAYTTEDAVPAGVTPAAVADHIAAVALFGKPSSRFLTGNGIAAPPVVIGPLYGAKTIDLCAPGDPICSPDGNDTKAHTSYAANGMVDQAAAFAVGRL
ncbi:MAG TPA: cutinase family protein [Mycobacterium sp.]|nr:cutinase family protein [Mycobacterium sp.]